MTTLSSTPPPDARSRRALLLASAAVFVVSLCAFSSLGAVDAGLAILTVLDRVTISGGAALAYLVAGVGIGRLMRPLFRGAGDPLALQVACGMAVLLWVSHLLGWLGLMGGRWGAWVAIAPIALGCGLALHQLFGRLRGAGVELAVSPFAVVAAPGLAILLVAACNPPGALWASEFGGYDVLEYHLQLPQEWLAMGRVAPLPHNVYSYLPGYLEAAYAHLGWMTMSPRSAAEGGPVGLAAGEGYRLISCQLLHAGFAVTSAWLTARLVRLVAAALVPPRAAPDPGLLADEDSWSARRFAPSLALSLVLLTPWSIVTGSMAYNEMAMLALFAGALGASVDAGLSFARRAALTGLLVGAASSVKPTALLLCGVPAGLLLLGVPLARAEARGLKSLAVGVALGAAAGMIMLAPWLVRNYLVAHNPVFPFAAGLFGNGPWTAEQVARYAGAHKFHGGFLERLSLLVMPDPHPGQSNVSAHRGLMHPQFGVLFPLAAAASIVLLRTFSRKELRRVRERAEAVDRGGLAAIGDLKGWGQEHDALYRRAMLMGWGALLELVVWVQLALWLWTTHVQARFLIPATVPAAVLVALAAVRLWPASRKWRPAARALQLALALAHLIYSASIFAHERAGKPNALLIQGPGLRTGQLLREMPPQTQREWIEAGSAELFINSVLPPDARVYLLGDSTPLYLTRPVVYNTTYDAWTVGGDPAAWSARLQQQHVDFVLVNLGEIGRLGRSGWLPPDVSLDAVKEWVVGHTLVVRAWDQMGVYLVRPVEPPHSSHTTPPPDAPRVPSSTPPAQAPAT